MANVFSEFTTLPNNGPGSGGGWGEGDAAINADFQPPAENTLSNTPTTAGFTGATSTIPPPATTTPATTPATTTPAETGYDWSKSWMSDPTGRNAMTGNNYGMNSQQFATDDTANYLAKALGGTVKNAPFDAAGPFSLNQNYNQIDMGKGMPQFNAGLISAKMSQAQGFYESAMRDWKLNGSIGPPPPAPTPESVMKGEMDYYKTGGGSSAGQATYSKQNVANENFASGYDPKFDNGAWGRQQAQQRANQNSAVQGGNNNPFAAFNQGQGQQSFLSQLFGQQGQQQQRQQNPMMQLGQLLNMMGGGQGGQQQQMMQFLQLLPMLMSRMGPSQSQQGPQRPPPLNGGQGEYQGPSGIMPGSMMADPAYRQQFGQNMRNIGGTGYGSMGDLGNPFAFQGSGAFGGGKNPMSGAYYPMFP